MKRTISSLLTILILLPALLTVSNAYDAVDTSFLTYTSSLEDGDSSESYIITCVASDGQVTLSWKNITADEYTVYFKRSNSDEWRLLKTTTKQVLIVTGLQNGLQYDFKMCFDDVESEIVTAVPHADDEIMLSVPEYCQYPEYPTGCECSALYMLLQFYSVDVTMEEIVEALPKGSVPYSDEDGVLYGANPDKEFVGDPRDVNSYGVYNEPIRNTAELFKSGAISQSGATVGDILKILSSGNPVIVWFTSNLEVVIDYRHEWLDYNTGETISWASYEHAVVVYGISDELVYYNDPQTGTGGSLDLETFAAAFESFGGRIVYYLQ
ncbi:MAG: C39 family peptidase [Oscillospiraceae bacterium]|nr:C39 family peptidase [Oscillospiraceae bacterium]